jgi:hypothetical protein
MKKQPLRSKYDYPHRQRRSMVHSWLVLLFGIIGAMIFLMSCSPRIGCPSHKGYSGYGWIKCRETKKVFILAPDGAIVCTYYESK